MRREEIVGILTQLKNETTADLKLAREKEWHRKADDETFVQDMMDELSVVTECTEENASWQAQLVVEAKRNKTELHQADETL